MAAFKEVHRKGPDTCSGHDLCPPRPNIGGSPNVFANNLPVIRATEKANDLYANHGCVKHSGHDGYVVMGSMFVFVNGFPVARKDDPIDCRVTVQKVMLGSLDVKAS